MTTLTIEVEVGLDVPPDVLGMWISQQLNRCDDTEAEDPDSLAPHFEELDNHEGPITVMWKVEPEKEVMP